MKIQFTSINKNEPGILASLLWDSYEELINSDPLYWEPEVHKWHQFDRDAFEHPETVGSCVFLSWSDDKLVGFGSFDPRQGLEYGIIGHNCILPRFRRNGFGKQQICEILRIFQSEGIKTALASTSENPFFLPAQRMYLACGFQEKRRVHNQIDSGYNMIKYQKEIG